jgi:hypothetical protein
MSEADLEVGVVREGGKPPRVVELGLPGTPAGAEAVKRKGQVLTLTGAEAAKWGLARGTCETTDDLRPQLGLAAWHKTDDEPWHIMTAAAKQARRGQEVIKRLGERMPELRAADARLKQAEARVMAGEIILTQLRRKREADLTAYDRTYESRAAQTRSASELKRLESIYRNGRANLEGSFDRQIEQCGADLATAKRDRDRLDDERDAIIVSIDRG